MDYISVNQVSLKHQWVLIMCGTHYTEENKQLKSDLANLHDKSRVVLRSSKFYFPLEIVSLFSHPLFACMYGGGFHDGLLHSLPRAEMSWSGL